MRKNIKKHFRIFLFSAIVVTVFIFISNISFADTLTGKVTGDNLNLRESPSLSGKVLTRVPLGTIVEICTQQDEWYNIVFGDIKGYVSAKFIEVRKSSSEIIRTGILIGANVNFRKSPTLDAIIIRKLTKGSEGTILEDQDNWLKLKLSDEVSGWVYKDFVVVRENVISRSGEKTSEVLAENAENAEITEDSQKGNEQNEISQDKNDVFTGNDIVEYGKTFLGVKYVYGGSSPKGFDCSGYAMYVFKHFGITLERTSVNQSKHGNKIARADLIVGDLVFFDTNGGMNGVEHVGIYIGDGKFIHSSSGRQAQKVVISDMSSGIYYNTFMIARRYLP
ncbi:MAG: NlpC/P60 family protein [Ignavibacteria bacterium]|nr:NlpC/P60 family protein [Ignavibacteria bacterium]